MPLPIALPNRYIDLRMPNLQPSGHNGALRFRTISIRHENLPTNAPSLHFHAGGTTAAFCQISHATLAIVEESYVLWRASGGSSASLPEQRLVEFILGKIKKQMPESHRTPLGVFDRR